MLYRIKNTSMGPVQLALKSRSGEATKLVVLPWKQTFDIPEEFYSEQIEALEKRGDVFVQQIIKK